MKIECRHMNLKSFDHLQFFTLYSSEYMTLMFTSNLLERDEKLKTHL